MDNYPEELIRGISNTTAEFISQEGYPTQGAFKFDTYNADLRNNDGFCELSINWVDDDNAINIMLNQINPRNNEIQFKGGYCKLNMQEVCCMLKAYIDNKHFSYERRPIEASEDNNFQGNPFHGNLLMKDNISKPVRTNIQASLAAIAGMVIKRPDD